MSKFLRNSVLPCGESFHIPTSNVFLIRNSILACVTLSNISRSFLSGWSQDCLIFPYQSVPGRENVCLYMCVYVWPCAFVCVSPVWCPYILGAKVSCLLLIPESWTLFLPFTILSFWDPTEILGHFFAKFYTTLCCLWGWHG